MKRTAHHASRGRSAAAPAAVLVASALGLLATGCGGGPAVVGVVAPAYPCYGCVGPGYGYGYGYGYGAITTVAVANGNAAGGSSAATSASSSFKPTALAFDTSGNLFIADPGSSTLREVAASASSASVSGQPSGKSIASAMAVGPTFNRPSAVAVGPAGSIYVLDQVSGVVRRMSPNSSSVTVVAGNPAGHPGFAGDHGPATSAQLNNPSSIAFDLSGNLFIADSGNHRVREVAASTGIITTIAGSGSAGYSGDGGPAIAAAISHPSAVVTDPNGNVYIADTANGTVRKVDVATGIISTVAGTGTIGFSGDNGPAVAAQLNNPRGLAVDPFGNLFIADAGNQSIREVAHHTGIISTVAGNHVQGYAGDGGASNQAELNTPLATAVDSQGNLYVADSSNGVVRKVLPDPQSTTAAN